MQYLSHLHSPNLLCHQPFTLMPQEEGGLCLFRKSTLNDHPAGGLRFQTMNNHHLLKPSSPALHVNGYHIRYAQNQLYISSIHPLSLMYTPQSVILSNQQPLHDSYSFLAHQSYTYNSPSITSTHVTLRFSAGGDFISSFTATYGVFSGDIDSSWLS